MAAPDIHKELADLQKQRRELSDKIASLENRPRFGPGAKRFREGERPFQRDQGKGPERDRNFRFQRDENNDAGGSATAKRPLMSSIASRLGPSTKEAPAEEDKGERGEVKEQVEPPAKRSHIVSAPRAVKPESAADRQRSQRMFGFLKNTLDGFKKKVEEKSEKETKKEQIQQEVEERLKKEQQESRDQFRQALQTHRQQERELRLNIAKKFREVKKTDTTAAFEKNAVLRKNFIRTKTEPSIYYLPKTHNDATKAKLGESAAAEKASVYADDVFRQRAQTNTEGKPKEGGDEGDAHADEDIEDEGADDAEPAGEAGDAAEGNAAPAGEDAPAADRYVEGDAGDKKDDAHSEHDQDDADDV